MAEPDVPLPFFLAACCVQTVVSPLLLSFLSLGPNNATTKALLPRPFLSQPLPLLLLWPISNLGNPLLPSSLSFVRRGKEEGGGRGEEDD